MDLHIEDRSFIVIAPRNYHQDLIKFFSSSLDKNIKYYTKEELLLEYFGKYKKSAVVFMMNKYNYTYENAVLYLNNINFFNCFENEKVHKLEAIKSDLINNNLIKFNPYISYELTNRKVYVIGYQTKDVELENVFKNVDCVPTYINYEVGFKRPEVLEFETPDQEVFHFFNTISKLIESGVKQEEIVLITDKENYSKTINRIAHQFNLNDIVERSYSLLSTANVLSIIKSIELVGLEEFLRHNEFSSDQDIVTIKTIIEENHLLDILDTSLQVNALKVLLKKEQVRVDFDKVFEVIDYIPLNCFNKHFFILGFNQDKFPIVNKDDDYFLNEEKISLGLTTSYNKNKRNKDELIEFITTTNNLYISYAKSLNGNSVYPSSLIKELNLKVTSPLQDVMYSKAQAQIEYAKHEDIYQKYGTISKDLLSYRAILQIPYCQFDNSFKGIDYQKENGLRVYSYSKIKSFFGCQFKYYLSNVLKLDEYEQTFPIKLGLILHDMLTSVYSNDFDFEKAIESASKNVDISSSERVILEKKKKEFSYLCQVIKEHKESMRFKSVECEKEYITKLKDDVAIKGKIDKVIITSDGANDFYSIVDYKTGNEKYVKNEVQYGYSMQLPTYALLLNDNKYYQNKELIGYYIQKCTCDKIGIPEDEHVFYRNIFKLQGESTNDIKKMETFDSTCANSLFIKSYGIKNKGEGEFLSRAKIASKKDFDDMIILARENFLKADEEIQKGNFIINPKIIINGAEESSECKYCKFKDICNVKNSDYVRIDIKGDEE